MRILITGGTGFIGRHLTTALVNQPDTAVTLLLRESYSHADLAALPPPLAALRDRFDVVYADLRNFRLTTRAVQQAATDAVIHLAAAGVTDPFLGVETALRHNVTGTLNLLRACCEKRPWPQRILVARTPGERSSMNVYAASKAAAWNFCRMYARTQQWPITGAMIFQAYGPGQPAQNLVPAAVSAALAGDDFPVTAGTQQRDWIYVDDVVAGLLAALRADVSPGETVELGTGRMHSVADVVQQIYVLIDSPGRPLIGVLPSRPGEVTEQAANAAHTRELLGWETAVSLSDGLKKVIASSRIR